MLQAHIRHLVLSKSFVDRGVPDQLTIPGALLYYFIWIGL